MDREPFLRRLTARLSGAERVEEEARRVQAWPAALSLVTHTAEPAGNASAGECEVMLGLFAERLAEIGGLSSRAATRVAALSAVARALGEGSERISCPPSLRDDAFGDRWTVDPREAGFGLSEAEWGIAETGTVVLRHRGPHGRGYSLVPPAVGFLLPVSRLVPRLGMVLTRIHEETSSLPASSLPACITFVSGPSHSADIAGTPCVGVHGPGRVHVWLIEDE